MKRQAHLLALILLFLSGCATTASLGAPVFPEPFPRAIATDVPEVPEETPLPVPLDEGEVAPFDGILVAGPELANIAFSAEQRDALNAALGVCYEGRDLDRETCADIVAAREVQLKEARIGQMRTFGLGAGIGGGVTLALVLAIVLGTR